MSLKQPVSPRTRRSNLQLYGSPNSPDEDRVFWKDAPYLGLPNIGPPTAGIDEYFCYNRTQEEIDHQYKIYSLIPKLPTRKIGKTAIEREEMWNRLLSYIPRKGKLNYLKILFYLMVCIAHNFNNIYSRLFEL